MSKKINNYKEINENVKAKENTISDKKKIILMLKKFNIFRMLEIVIILLIVCTLFQVINCNKLTINKVLNVKLPYNNENVWYGYIDANPEITDVTLDNILNNSKTVEALIENDNALEYLINSKDIFTEFTKHQTAISALNNNDYAKYKVLTNAD